MQWQKISKYIWEWDQTNNRACHKLCCNIFAHQNCKLGQLHVDMIFVYLYRICIFYVISCLKYYIDFDTYFFYPYNFNYSYLVHVIFRTVSCFNYFFMLCLIHVYFYNLSCLVLSDLDSYDQNHPFMVPTSQENKFAEDLVPSTP